MSLATDIAADWRHVDGIETVTYTERPAGTETTTAKAHRDQLSFREVKADGPAGLEPTDVVWVIWAATLRSGARPTQGDTITDSGGLVYVVLSLSVGAFDRIGTTIVKYRCVCRQQL